MRIVCITDTHWGIRGDNLTFLDYHKQFLDTVFFPFIDKHKIKKVFHLGDLVDRRKYINFYTATRLREDFLEPLQSRGLDFDIIAGNHDTFYKSTNQINALNELVTGAFPSFSVYTEPTEIEVQGTKILLLPWINQENQEKSFALINKTKAQICFGHLDLTGFEMRRGVIEHDGQDPGIFNKFDTVLTGHFHHKHSHNNIHYLGSPLQFDWSDYNDPRGFHVFDTDSRELVFIENPLIIFKKIWYNDKDKNVDEVVENFEFDRYAGCFVKVIIEEKTNPYWYDTFIEKLEDHATDVRPVDDHKNMDTIEDEEIVGDAEDTFTIFKKTIEQMDNSVDKEELTAMISELYNEAQMME